MHRDEQHADEGTGGLWDGAEIISGYSRAEAIADGVLVDLNQRPTPERPELDDLDAIAREAGIKHPAAMTAAAFFDWINPSDADRRQGQSINGRLCDLYAVFKLAAKAAKGRTDLLTFPLIVWKDGRQQTARIKAVCGPGDRGEPVLTFMLPGED